MRKRIATRSAETLNCGTLYGHPSGAQADQSPLLPRTQVRVRILIRWCGSRSSRSVVQHPVPMHPCRWGSLVTDLAVGDRQAKFRSGSEDARCGRAAAGWREQVCQLGWLNCELTCRVIARPVGQPLPVACELDKLVTWVRNGRSAHRQSALRSADGTNGSGGRRAGMRGVFAAVILCRTQSV